VSASPPQRDALEVVFGISAGEAPNPFLVGLAVLGLLSDAAEERPLLCAVDDAQWLDRTSAGALAFVARRLLAEKIVLLFEARDLGDTLAGLRELQVEGLDARNARALLESVLPARLDGPVLERLIVEARGNQLALLEMPRGLTPVQLAGGFGLPAALPLSSQLEENFARRLRNLPRDACQLLLLAAADPVGDPALIWRAARRLGIPESAADTVQAQGLLSLGARVAFRHPLARSAVYRTSAPADRREVHRALAEATDSDADPDRRAWHRAQATSMPVEEVAAELERSAARAQARGGFAAAAAFLDRATALTPDEARRSGRALAAAHAQLQAGALSDALRVLATAEAGVLNELEQTRAGLLRAQITFASTRGTDATSLFLKAAERLRELDPQLARETYLEALTAAIYAGPLAGAGASSPEVAQAARGAPPAREPRGLDLLLDGLVALFTDGYVGAVPILRQAQRAIEGAMSEAEQLRWMWGATVSSMHLWDDEAWERLSSRHLQLVRETGALGDLAMALGHRGQMHVFAGELAWAASLNAVLRETTELTGSPLAPYHAAGLVAEIAVATDRTLTERSKASGTDWALGIAARSHALLANDERAEELHAEAIERLARTRVAVDVARAHLLYGEWLRRQSRRVDARKRASDRSRNVLRLRNGGFCRARTNRTAGDRRASSQANHRDARSTHAPGVTGLPPRGRRKHKQRDCSSAVHQSEHGRVPPTQGIPQARRQIAHAACQPPAVAGPRRRFAPAGASSSPGNPRTLAGD
jgi:hypothetical protein